MPNPTSKLNLVINGATTQLDIHDANAVDLSSNQTVAGNKEFTGTTTAHDLMPSATGTYNLGSSTNKWKSFNGINPGALSLPDYMIFLDTTSWNLTGITFTYTPTADGWLFVNIQPDNNYAYVAFETGHMRSNSESTTGKNAMTFIAVRANAQIYITLIGASIAQARLVTCAGNV